MRRLGALLRARWADLAAGLALIVALGLYATLLTRAVELGHAEPDIDAYVWLGKSLWSGNGAAVADDDPFRFHSHAWVDTVDGRVTTKYAPGFPLLLGLAWRIGGDDAMFVVPALLSWLTLLGMYLLLRAWTMSRIASLAAVVALACNPLFLFHANYLLAHTSNMCVVTWGMLFLWRWWQRPRVRTGLAAGLLLGGAVSIRHTSLLFTGAVAIALLAWAWRVRRTRPLPWRPAAALAAGLALIPLALAAYQHGLFGAPWRTGYALSDEQAAFTLDAFRTNGPSMIQDAWRHLLFLLLPFGVAGLIVVGPGTARAMRLAWAVPLVLLYGCYYWYLGGAFWFRFHMAVFPVLIGAAFALLDGVRAAWPARAAAVVLLAGTQVWFARNDIEKAWDGRMHLRDTMHAPAGRALDAHTADDAVVFTTGHYEHYTARRDHRTSYALDRFQSGYGARAFRPRDATPDRRRRFPEPRRQSARTERLKHFYATHDDAALEAWRHRIVRQALDAGREVVFLVPEGMASAVPRYVPNDVATQSITPFAVPRSAGRGRIRTNDWAIVHVGPVAAADAQSGR